MPIKTSTMPWQILVALVVLVFLLFFILFGHLGYKITGIDDGQSFGLIRSDMQSELDTAISRADTLEDEKARLLSLLEKNKEQLNQNLPLINSLQRSESELKSQLQDAWQSNHDMGLLLESLETETDELKQQLEETRRLHSQGNRSIETLEDESSKLTNELLMSQTIAARMQSRIDSLNERVIELEALLEDQDNPRGSDPQRSKSFPDLTNDTLFVDVWLDSNGTDRHQFPFSVQAQCDVRLSWERRSGLGFTWSYQLVTEPGSLVMKSFLGTNISPKKDAIGRGNYYLILTSKRDAAQAEMQLTTSCQL